MDEWKGSYIELGQGDPQVGREVEKAFEALAATLNVKPRLQGKALDAGPTPLFYLLASPDAWATLFHAVYLKAAMKLVLKGLLTGAAAEAGKRMVCAIYPPKADEELRQVAAKLDELLEKASTSPPAHEGLRIVFGMRTSAEAVNQVEFGAHPSLDDAGAAITAMALVAPHALKAIESIHTVPGFDEANFTGSASLSPDGSATASISANTIDSAISFNITVQPKL